MTKKIKILLSGISITLCVLIAFTYPVQVVAQNIPTISEEVASQNIQQSSPYEVGKITGEVLEEREQYVKHFRLDDGTFMAVSYQQPVHFKDEKGNWLDYDNSLIDDSVSNEYTNTQSDIKINYSKKSKDNNMIKVKSDDFSVSWGYADTNNVTARIVTDDEKLYDNEQYTTLKNLTSEIIYENAYNNVDIQYITSSVGVKENIILKNSYAQSEFFIEYKINSLTPNLVNDKLIQLLDKDSNVVFSIKAPYMIDADGKTSTQLSLSILEQKNNKVTIRLSADEDFLSNSKYPITIDPEFTTTQEWQSAECSYVDSSLPNTAYGFGSETGYSDTVYVGTFGAGTYRLFYRIKELPALNKGDMIVGAYLHMALLNNDFYDNMDVSAYQLSENWEQSSLTWNNQPNYDSNIVDYEMFNSDSEIGWYDWNITSCMKKWYNGSQNYGIMLMTPNDVNATQCASFASSNYSYSTTPRPLFSIIYRNNKGLEDYWSYSSFSVGTAGTAYVNDYSGNLVFVTSDATTASGYSTANIQHVYNGYMANVRYTTTVPYVGRGWRLNLNQTIVNSSKKGLEGEAQSMYPYVYTDGDGTDHYFYKKTENGSTKYLDEDGLGLELTINSSNTKEYFVISDDKDNKIKFYSSGRLNYTEDSNGNKITLNYTDDLSTINSVTDGSGNVLTLNKATSGGNLSSIVDTADRTTEYVYDSNNNLIKIINPDKTSINFTYDGVGSLLTVTDIDGYKVKFSYTSVESGRKVSAIQEYATDGTAGQKITFDRTKYNTTILNTYGADGVTGTNDDLTSTYQFDEFGRTISVKSRTVNRDMGATVYRYTDGKINSSAENIKQLNRVSTGYSTGANAINLVSNSNMESETKWISSSWSGITEFTTTYSTEEQYFGKKSLKINVTAYENLSKGRVYQDLNNTLVVPGGTYTLSGYIKTTGVTNSTTNSGALLCAESFNSDGTSNPYYTDIVTGNTSSSVDNGWQRVSITFTVPENSEYTRINLALCGSTGTAYFDGIQVEKYNVANDYNMLENSGLENYSSSGLPTSWKDGFTTINNTTDSVSTTHQQGEKSYCIKGESDTVKSIYQEVPVSGTENDTYIVSGWAKANAVPKNEGDTRKFKISVRVYYTDGYDLYKTPAEFNYSISDWQYTSTAFTLSDDDETTNRIPTAVRIYLSYQNQANKVYFDNICLEKDNAQSYIYNEDGKLISVVDNSKEKSTMEYTNSDLTKNIDAKGYAYEYEYDDNHNMTKATSQNGVNYNYTYNGKGLATTLEVNGSNVSSLKSEVTYDSKGLLETTKDQDGNQVTYEYNSDTGTLTSVEDSSGKTSYEYDTDTNLLTSMNKTNEFSERYEVTYSYSDDSKYLETISHNGTNYNLEYDKFGNKTDSKVGTQSLASYTYNSNNGSLTNSTYGNGQTVSYVYDEYGNVKTRKYNGTTAFSWYTDRSGSVIREQDHQSNFLYDYTYDSTGRLVRKTAKSTVGEYNANKSWYTFEYSYDLNNNITRLANKTQGFTATGNYIYGKDNLLTKYNISSEKAVNYTYDGLNRLTKTSLTTTTPIDTTYTYYDSLRGNGYTTTKLKSETIAGVTYTYVYDTIGNITDIYRGSVETGTHLYYYEYDKMNQLTYVYDYENLKAYSYTYDLGGNIISENISDIDANGAPLNNRLITYSYTDTNWTDKLTLYDGQSITYDAIGNPLTYRDGMTMTWKNGRQLSSLQKGTDSLSYEYDSNSVRISKTVNGVKHTYAYLNGMLMYETRGEAKYYYSYDANGILYNVKYTLTDDSEMKSYFYTHNSRGDIVGIYSGSGVLTAQYEYDVWGNILSITDGSGNVITDPNNVGNLNPFRYRGYYYDSDTGLYYLMSRYYDPVTHRFLNSDGYFQSGGGILDANMNAYCRNNPIMCVDPTGAVTWLEGQKMLASGTKIFDITAITKAQLMGYGPNDEVPFLSKLVSINFCTGEAEQTSTKTYGVRYYMKNASYVYDGNDDSLLSLNIFYDEEDALRSSVSANAKFMSTTYGLDDMSTSYGIPWEKNFYGFENSFSFRDNFVWRCGFTGTIYNEHSNNYYEFGGGIEISAFVLASVGVAVYCGPLIATAFCSTMSQFGY